MFSQLQKTQNKLSETRLTELTKESTAATDMYNACYNNLLYSAAINGKTANYGVALQDDALAICGDPWRQMSRRDYCKEAKEFLNIFMQAMHYRSLR